MPSIALTGGFGTGKTTVLRMFGKLGARTVEIDGIVHDILQDPGIIKKIGAVLGDSVLDGSQRAPSVNRRRVAGILFNDPEKRKAVEGLIHPVVLTKIRAIMKDTLRNNPRDIIIFEIPLLFEAGYEKYFDTVAVVFCNRKTSFTRLKKKGFSRDEAGKRMRAQLPMSFKKKAADFLIDNNDGRDRTAARVRRIFRKCADNMQ